MILLFQPCLPLKQYFPFGFTAIAIVTDLIITCFLVMLIDRNKHFYEEEYSYDPPSSRKLKFSNLILVTCFTFRCTEILKSWLGLSNFYDINSCKYNSCILSLSFTSLLDSKHLLIIDNTIVKYSYT